MSELTASLQTHAPTAPSMRPPLDSRCEMRIRERWQFWIPQVVLRAVSADPIAMGYYRDLHYCRSRVVYDLNIPRDVLKRHALDSPIVTETEFILRVASALERRAKFHPNHNGYRSRNRKDQHAYVS